MVEGKTLAGAIFNLISWEFEDKCLMANVRKELEKGGALVYLRELVLSKILEENIKIRTSDLPEYTRERLQQMELFIVLNDVLKISYNDLKSEEKNMFLDIACFFVGDDEDSALRILDGFISVLNVLVDKSLISLSYSNMWQMHD